MLNIKSRRSFFRYMAVFGFAAFYASQLHAKTSKEIVKYRDMPKEEKNLKSVYILYLRQTSVKLSLG